MSEEKLPMRGLTEGFEQTPLRKFYGTLDGTVKKHAENYDGVRVDLNFKDLEVIQSTSPYNFPITTINLGVSNKAKSRWGYFATSVAAVIDESEGLEEQYGKRFGMVYCDGQDGRPEPKPIWSRQANRAEFPTGEVPTAVWVAFEIDGVTADATKEEATPIEEKLITLLDGKTLNEFNRASLADPEVKKDTAIQRAIMDKSFVKKLIADGIATKDENDIYHKA